MVVSAEGCLPKGCLNRGVSTQVGCLPRWGVCPGSVSAKGQVYPGRVSAQGSVSTQGSVFNITSVWRVPHLVERV